jgi:hypothetical protein
VTIYAVLRCIQVQPHFVEESVQRIKLGLVPLLRKEPGFVEMYVILVGEEEGVSISIFETGRVLRRETGNRWSGRENRSSHWLWGLLKSSGSARSCCTRQGRPKKSRGDLLKEARPG